uniref:DNA (cytosine-5-)-methyltransferase n=1 Tax=viral metagenome TaxID=1070528 RepID=A0A6C0KX43_9ZZZZ
MVNYVCPKCEKEFKQKGHYETHMKRVRPCTNRPPALTQEPTKPMAGLKFIDLFSGIGGFHLALKSLGAECVLACDIDKKCREVYKDNFGLEPHPDITELKTEEIPDFDVLCGGFPCQAFSHAGAQGGFADTRGTLFKDICRILKDKQPSYFLLENVKNLKGHDGGKTIKVIFNSLREVGYTTYDSPILLSPHHIGVPQHRERVFILGIRNDLTAGKQLAPFPAVKPTKTDISSVLEPIQISKTTLTATDEAVLNLWEEFVQHFKAHAVKLPGFPLWSDDWNSTYEIKTLPAWKQKFITNNREFYQEHQQFLQPWLTRARNTEGFAGARRKFEWQAGTFKPEDSLWTLLFTFRPSGIRVKRTNYSPALVAMAQIVYVGSRRRKLTPREVARLQSFPDSFKMSTSSSAAYKQFGNSVNVNVITHMANWLMSMV